MRYWPSTRSASFDSAERLSRVRALSAVLAVAFSARRIAFFGALPRTSALPSAVMMSCSDNRACQTSIVGISANSAIASRYAATEANVTSRASASVNPLLRAAIVKLAAIRLTSYSNGPGSVSSKSFRSNTSVRSGDA